MLNIKISFKKKNNKKVVLRDPPSFWEKLFEQFKCSDKK